MTTAFQMAAKALISANERFFTTKELSSVGHRDAREAAMQAGLPAMAAEFGVTLQGPIYVDSRGEMSIVALKPGSTNAKVDGCAKFGDFAEHLTRNHARTGVAPGIIDPDNGWCMMSHFGVEKMLLAYRVSQLTQAALAEAGTEPVVARKKPKP